MPRRCQLVVLLTLSSLIYCAQHASAQTTDEPSSSREVTLSTVCLLDWEEVSESRIRSGRYRKGMPPPRQ